MKERKKESHGDEPKTERKIKLDFSMPTLDWWFKISTIIQVSVTIAIGSIITGLIVKKGIGDIALRTLEGISIFLYFLIMLKIYKHFKENKEGKPNQMENPFRI